MHVSQMLKMFDVGGTVQPPTSTDNAMDGYETILSMLKDIKSSNQTSEVKTSLNEKQAMRLMDSVLEFYETYFNEVPISSSISKNFVWNVPEDVYRQTIDCVDKGYDDILNPMMLFYAFLMDTDEYAYGKYLQILHRILSENKQLIDELAKEYDQSLQEE